MEIGFTLNGELKKNIDFSRKDKQEIKSLNEWIGNVKRKDTRLYKVLVFTVAGLSYSFKAYADVTGALTGIDKVGFTFLSILQKVGYWGCLLGCFVEILKSLMNSGSKDIWKIFMKYIAIFTILYLLPWGFNLIAEIFAGL